VRGAHRDRRDGIRSAPYRFIEKIVELTYARWQRLARTALAHTCRRPLTRFAPSGDTDRPLVSPRERYLRVYSPLRRHRGPRGTIRRERSWCGEEPVPQLSGEPPLHGVSLRWRRFRFSLRLLWSTELLIEALPILEGAPDPRGGRTRIWTMSTAGRRLQPSPGIFGFEVARERVPSHGAEFSLWRWARHLGRERSVCGLSTPERGIAVLHPTGCAGHTRP